MQKYLVGGAVRDRLLNIEVKDRDWVVVGVTPKQMLDAGYQQVGADFPVFLHPENGEEYALARTERKSGRGYNGFICDASPDISIEDDLARRDLTINAIAEDENGDLIDPWGGLNDLNNKVLRHVSPAFSEDPLRVLRAARFAARFAHLGFKIAPETSELMQQMSLSGELIELTPERVFGELEKALCSQTPRAFFEVLRKTKALAEILPELDRLWGIPNPVKWHPEIDTGLHTMLVLEQICLLNDKPEVRFAALCHDFGKAKTDPKYWPSHPGHEKAGVAVIEALAERIPLPNRYLSLAKLASEYHCHLHKVTELRPSTLLKLFNRFDVWRKAERFEHFLDVCEADARGRTGLEDRPYPQKDYMKKALSEVQSVSARSFVEAGYQGAQIKQQMEQARLEKLKQLKVSWQSQ
ncbi:multifunctional CCA addition/repair protein [Gayadomonas joobiniege]|uniref:multifunctional CCA addition/repair protein n=1 Tax=Gayadomonas joobiniege TaxID=1234606 RepID=UPI00035F8D26|nr:multifunctional CCA addition/repair protein [Gayadomonas joobiniege]